MFKKGPGISSAFGSLMRTGHKCVNSEEATAYDVRERLKLAMTEALSTLVAQRYSGQ